MAKWPNDQMTNFEIRFFVFDLDGTLVDSRRDIADSANAVLEECGCRPHSEEAIGGMVGDGAALLIRRAFDAAGCPPPVDALERFLRVYNDRLLRHTRLYDGIPQLLESLASRGPLAVLTNKPLDATRTILSGLGLSKYFGDRVLGGDGPHARKPDPSGLLQLVDAAGVDAATTLMVGDSIIDARTARKAGARVCIARYGFGYHPGPDDPQPKSDLFVDRPLDLLGILL
jgi:phosphoglycolate phosphatase